MQKVVHLLSRARNIEMFEDISQTGTSLSKYLFKIKGLLLVICLLFALQASSQDLTGKKININLKDAAIKSALMEVQKQSGINFSYGQDISKYAAIKVNISGKDITVKQAVDLILKNTNLRMIPMQNYIVIEEKPAPKSPNAAAGQGPGTIKGRIVEFETSQPLPGASVYIVELQKGMQSSSEGYYKFANIPSGKYTLKVTYISYKTENVSVEVKADKEETYDVKIQGSNSLQEVVVSSVRKSRAPVAHTTERQVLEQVKQASSVVSAISSEQISKSADRNAAEVAQRIAGVTVMDDKFVVIRGLNQRYNLTLLNDNVAPSTEVNSRAFALDLIPSRIIDRILVYKSPSPENQADATGGVMKIYTKDATAVKHLDIEFQTGVRPGTTFNNQFLSYSGGKLDFLGFDDGTRKLPSSVPGYNQLKLAQLTPSQYAETFNPTLTYHKITALPTMQFTANYYNAFKVWNKSLSMLTSVSYKNDPQKTEVRRQQGRPELSFNTQDKTSEENRNMQVAQLNLLQNFTLRLRDSSMLFFKNFILQQGQNATIVRTSHLTLEDFVRPGSGIIPVPVYNKDNILSYKQRFLYSGNLGGNHYFGKGHQQLRWNGGYIISRQSTPDQRVIRLTVPAAHGLVGDSVLQWRARGLNPQTTDDVTVIPNQLGIISRLWMRNTESNYNGSVDYVYKWKPWFSFKAGTFQQWKERSLYRRIYTVHEGDVDVNNSSLIPTSGPGSQHYLDPQLVRFREQDLPSAWSKAYLRDDYVGLRVADRTSGSDSYIGTEQNNSGYVAFSFTPLNKKFEVYGGIRYEYNRQKIGAAIPPEGQNAINTPVYVDHTKTDWLPSVNLSWRPISSWVVRAAYGKTVNRTEFREVSPFTELDYENNLKIMGNPKLIPANITNYDFRAEFYPRNNSKGEMISAGIFYKQLQNPVEVIGRSTAFFYPEFPVFTYQNAASATIKGLEIELNKKLDFIPGTVFRNLSLVANLSLIKSETQNDTSRYAVTSKIQTPNKRPLQGQVPYVINAGLYYDQSAWGTRVSAILNARGTSIYSTGPAYGDNLLELSRRTIDIAIGQRVIKSLQLKFSIQNLLDQEIRMAEDDNLSNKYEPLGSLPDVETTQAVSGAKVTMKGGDNVALHYKPGRFFLLNLSYSF